MNVSIIIVNYNTKDLISNCITSIIEFTKDISYEIIIVDNASTDGSQIFIKDNFDTVKLIESEVNLGFGLANNLGADEASGEFLFFLNSDTILIENSIKKLYDFFIEYETKLNIGVLGTLLIDENMSINGFGNVFPDCKGEILKLVNQIPFLGKAFSLPETKKYPLHLNFFEIEYVIGADMFMKKTLFNEMKGFSKDFFMYYEESDIQKRVCNIGYKNFIYTGTKIVHLEDGSGKIIKKYNNRKRMIVHRSRNIYLKRNDTQNFGWYRILDFMLAGITFLNLKYTFQENKSYFKEVVSTLRINH